MYLKMTSSKNSFPLTFNAYLLLYHFSMCLHCLTEPELYKYGLILFLLPGFLEFFVKNTFKTAKNVLDKKVHFSYNTLFIFATNH